MTTRKHVHEIELAAPPERVFALLHTPSAIRAWWSASRAIVMAKTGGVWVATWGANEDDPDYISASRICVFDPPRRMLLADSSYYAKSGPLPFQAEFVIEFTVEPRPQGSLLRVVQDGFPTNASADSFYLACEVGWRTTFEGIRRFLQG